MKKVTDAKIVDLVVDMVPKTKIIFITAQYGKSTSDVDIYCVADVRKSYVHIFLKNDRLYEIFIDSIKNLKKKAKNKDEITFSFLHRMRLVYGDKTVHNNFNNLFPTRYSMPEYRLQKLIYRIKVISSKYTSSKNDLLRNFFLGQLIQYFIMLEFHLNGIWPASPKKWLEQLSQMNTATSKQLISLIANKNTNVGSLILEYTKNFKGLDLEYFTTNQTLIV